MKRKPLKGHDESWAGTVLRTRFGVAAANWVFQGMRYMNGYETSLKLALDALLAAVVLWMTPGQTSAARVIFAVLLAHSVNWLVNGHFFVLMRYVRPFPKPVAAFGIYAESLRQRAEQCARLDAVAIYGSYCRGELHEHSDLDVRVFVGEGIFNGTIGALFCLKERCFALFARFPLDIYCFVGIRPAEQLREDESPVILFDRSGKVSHHYSQSQSWD